VQTTAPAATGAPATSAFCPPGLMRRIICSPTGSPGAATAAVGIPTRRTLISEATTANRLMDAPIATADTIRR
jgi:hypothetical protein